MAKEKDKQPKPKTKRPSRILAFFRDDRTRFIVGLLFLFVGALMALAFVSFMINAGKADYAALADGTIMRQQPANIGGTFGAYISEICINNWLGISAFLYVIIILRLGYRLLRNLPLRSLFNTFVLYACWSVWISLCCSYVVSLLAQVFPEGNYLTTYIYLGGQHGYALEQRLSLLFGNIGVPLLLVVSLLILLVFVTNNIISQARNGFGLIGIIMRWRERQLAASEAARLEKEAQLAAAEAAADAPAAAPEEISIEGQTIETVSEPLDVVDEPSEIPAASDPFAPVMPAAETSVPEEPSETSDPSDPSLPSLPSEPAVTPLDPNFTVHTNTTEIVKEPVEMPLEDYDPTADLEYYKFPTFDLLKDYDARVPIDMDEQNENKEKIRQTLSDYGIEIQSISATVGPTITLFEIVLENGQRINRVRSLSDEIAMSIASRTGIRIIAPIPGKCAIGIEVPNKDPQTVSMRECVQSRAFQESKYNLPVALGKTITNEVFTFDLCKAPHLLVAGATGQGKSVGLNAILTSLLYKKHPSQLKIVLVDPKMVEFSIYSRIDKHFLAKLPDDEDPIVTDVSKVVQTLKSLCAEMEDRYALLRVAGCRKIEEYNEKFIHRQLNPKVHIEAPIGSKAGTNHHYLPYIVVIVDEYGDLIMTAGKEVELPIARIAQKARAVGIHMIIATQRPSAKIVTGIIKANFPGRIAFRVSSATDSGIILDQSGAQNLIGRGDLFVSLGDKFERVQCAFVDTPEVDRINAYIEKQQSYPTCYILPEPKPDPNDASSLDDGGPAGAVDLNQLDPLFNECAELVVGTGQGSTSMIQRKFGIGYNRAGRIMDQLEAAGIVGPYSGSKARAVLIDSTSELMNKLEELRSS